MKKKGRPPAQIQRQRTITVRVSDAELETLAELAKASGTTLSEFCRLRSMAAVPVGLPNKAQPVPPLPQHSGYYAHTAPKGLCPRCTRMGKAACDSCIQKIGRIHG